MQTRYLVRMLGIAVFHMFAFVTFMTIAGQFDALIIALPMNLSVLVILNLAGAWVIFRPIQRHLGGDVDLAGAHRRINRLALTSAAWAALLVGMLLATGFFVLGASCPRCDPAVMLPFHLAMIVLFCTFVGIFIFFLISDYTAGLKIFIFEATGEIFTPAFAARRSPHLSPSASFRSASRSLKFLPSPKCANCKASPRHRASCSISSSSF